MGRGEGGPGADKVSFEFIKSEREIARRDPKTKRDSEKSVRAGKRAAAKKNSRASAAAAFYS